MFVSTELVSRVPALAKTGMRSALVGRVFFAASLTLVATALPCQDCNSSTGAGGGTQGSACIETGSMVSYEYPYSSLLESKAMPSLPGENFVWGAVKIPPASTTTATDIRQALGLVSNKGLVLATGGEFRQTVGLIRTAGIDSEHPLQIQIDYRSYFVDAWRGDGDGVGTTDDPFGPGWRASWGDMLLSPNENGDPITRIDSQGVRWTYEEPWSPPTTFGPTWRTYEPQAGTRLVLEYYIEGGQYVPHWFREWPDRTRVEYAANAASGANLVTKRMYRGSYSAPDWEVVYNYDSSTGRLNSITDARGIQHTFTWTTYGLVSRITKLSTTVPGSWSPGWSAIETNFEYETTAPYRLKRVLRPARTFLDDQDRSGAYDLPTESFTGQVVTYFSYKGGNRIQYVYDESTGLARQMLQVGYDTSVTWRVATLTEGETSSLPGQGQRTQVMTYPQAGQSQWVDARGVTRLYTYDTSTFGASPRQWRVTRIEETAGSNDPRPVGDTHFHSSLVYEFTYACGCGQITGIKMPSGLEHVVTYDGEGRGLVTSTGVIPSGGSTAQQVRNWSYRSWNDSDYRLASRLSGYTDALSKTGTNTFTYDTNYGGYRVDGTFDGVALFSVQEDAKGRVVWTEEGAFSVDGGGSATSNGRVGYTVGTSTSSPNYQLTTQVDVYNANGATIYSSRTFSYEGLGWLTSLTDEKGRTATFSHNTIGQLTSVVLPTTSSGRGSSTYGATFAFAYDRYGQVAKTTRTANDDRGTAYARSTVVSEQVYDYFSRPWKETTESGRLDQSAPTVLTTTYEYDLGNRVLRVAASGGRLTEYLLDDHDKLYQQRSKLDSTNWSVEEHGYHEDGLLAHVMDPTGLEGTVDTLDAWGRPQRIHLPGDKHIYLSRDNEDRVLTSEYRTDASGSTLQQTGTSVYDSLGRVLTETLSAPGVTTTRNLAFTYNGPFRVATMVDGDGRGATYGYDAQGRLIRKQDRLLGTSGNAEVFVRDVMGNVERVDQVEQRETSPGTFSGVTSRTDLAYDNWDRLIRADFYGQAASIQFSRYRGYDSLSNQTWGKDGVGKETLRGFDAAGRMVDEWRHQRTFANPAAHLGLVYNDTPSDPTLSAILTRTDGIGNPSEYHYDLLGRMVERRLPGFVAGPEKQWEYTYDLVGRLTQWRDGNGAIVQQNYDSEKRLAERRVLQLPTNGVVLSTMATHETWAYDDFGRVVSAQTWWSQYPQFSGTQPPSLVEAVDAYDGIGRQTLERFRYLDDTNAGYVPLATKDLVYGFAKGGGLEDASIRRSMATSAGFNLGWTPDGVGKLASMTMCGPGIAAQDLASWRYEGNRQIRRSFLPGTSTPTELVTAFVSNDLGHMTQLTTTKDVSGTPTHLYDLVMARDVEGNVLQHQYTKAGGKAGDWFQLDGWDRLQGAKMGVTSFAGSYSSATGYDKKITYALDMAHNRSTVDEEIGGNSSTTSYTLKSGTNEYDQVTDPNDPSGAPQTWTYDGNGNLLSDGYYLYVYDHLDRLSEVYVLTYPGGGTDAEQGQTVVRIFAAPEQKRRDGKETVVPVQLWRDQVLAARQRVQAARASAASPASDPRLPMGVNSGTTSTAVAVDEPIPVLIAYYGYDPSNRRIGKLFADYSGVFYAWSGWDLTEAYDLGFAATTVWFEGSVIDEHLGYAWKNPSTGAWVRYGYVLDHARSIAIVADSTGAVAEKYEYDPYGRMLVFSQAGVPIGQVPTASGQAYGFMGGQIDAESGLMYFRHRYYHPASGRFLTCDPLGLWRDKVELGNAYSYVGGHVLVLQDPLGLGPGGPFIYLGAGMSGLQLLEQNDMLNQILEQMDGLPSGGGADPNDPGAGAPEDGGWVPGDQPSADDVADGFDRSGYSTLLAQSGPNETAGYAVRDRVTGVIICVREGRNPREKPDSSSRRNALLKVDFLRKRSPRIELVCGFHTHPSGSNRLSGKDQANLPPGPEILVTPVRGPGHAGYSRAHNNE